MPHPLLKNLKRNDTDPVYVLDRTHPCFLHTRQVHQRNINAGFKYFHKFVANLEDVAKKVKYTKGTKEKDSNKEKHMQLLENVYDSCELGLVPPPEDSVISSLSDRFPNLAPAIHVFRDYYALSRFSGEPSPAPPILLVGSPGSGKTIFAQELVSKSGFPYRIISGPSITGAHVLGGLDSSWAHSKEGAILELILSKKVGNSAIIIDEVDKIGKSSGSIANAEVVDFLLTCLEPVTAKQYCDEFLSSAFRLDISKLQWIFTANDIKPLSEPFLSRTHVIEVQEPTRDEYINCIIPHLYRKLVEDLKLTNKVPNTLPEHIIERLTGSTREIRILLVKVLADYVRDGRFSSDGIAPYRKKKSPIGFNTKK